MNQQKCKRIFIIGHTGAGKALFGKTLAEKLGWQFIDADLGLESRVGRSLYEIVGKPGSVEMFYECQSKILSHQLSKKNIVVATDAGLLATESNRKLIEPECVVYLKVSTPIQIKRASRGVMPLLEISDYGVFLDKLHDEYDDIYEKSASLTVDTDNSALEEHVSHVITAIAGKDIAQLTNKAILNKNDTTFFHKTLHTPVHLSEQQARCLKLLAQGKTSKEIANEMNISYRTVEDYIARTMEQLGCSSGKELIALYHNQP